MISSGCHVDDTECDYLIIACAMHGICMELSEESFLQICISFGHSRGMFEYAVQCIAWSQIVQTSAFCNLDPARWGFLPAFAL